MKTQEYNSAKTWTKPHHSVTHYGEPTDGHWATVVILDNAAQLKKWYPGCKFSPIREIYDTVNEAKSAGELWANKKELNNEQLFRLPKLR